MGAAVSGDVDTVRGQAELERARGRRIVDLSTERGVTCDHLRVRMPVAVAITDGKCDVARSRRVDA